MEPFTEDDSYIEAMNALLPPLLTIFAPDIIVSLHGCDTHAWDPLTHLELTMRGIATQMKLAHQLAHTYCEGRWVALGGGGYDLFRVVPRAWSRLWAEMSEQQLPAKLPEEWVRRWLPAWLATEEQEIAEQEVMGKDATQVSFPTTFEDRREDFPPQPRRLEISHTNALTVSLVRHLLVPSAVRHALTSMHYHSPLENIFDHLHPQGSATPSRIKRLETPKGTFFLRDFCPPSLIERLKADEGLRAFARVPEREQQLLLNIAKSPDCALTIAHTDEGKIVGQVTLAPGDDWFKGLENVFEITIEVSSNWRGVGLANELLAFALDLDTLEEMIFFAMGLWWHWDIEGLKMSPQRYRQLIKKLFASQGFTEYATSEPDISMEPANVLMARIGKRVDQYTARRFLDRLKATPRY